MAYTVLITKTADKDIASIVGYIAEECYAPEAAIKLYNSLKAKLHSLQDYADIYAFSTWSSIKKYGAQARHVTCKGFAIIYTIDDSTVIVHRIIHGSLIT